MLVNQGDGTFAIPIPYAVGVEPASVVAADLAGDGRPDLAVASYYGVSVLIDQGNASFGVSVDYAG